jgi:DNA-binding MarR family transcriptional regulator
MKPQTIAAQTQQLNMVFQNLICITPHLRGVLPADLAQARERLQLSSGPFSKQFGDNQLMVFYRLALILSQREASLTMSEFGDSLAVPLSTATRAVDWLVQSGYVERRQDPEDRRIVRVALTENGKELYKTLNKFVTKHVEQILRHFTANERVTLIALMSKVVDILQELSLQPHPSD